MAFDKKSWREENREKARLHSARYRLRKKGLDLPPETLAELERLREEKKAASAERRKEINRRWNREHKEQRAARTKERYTNDPEFRERTLELARARRAKNKPVLTEEQKANRLRQKREAQVKATRASTAKAALARQEMGRQAEPKRPAPKPNVLTEAQRKAPKWKVKKPGRLIALCGWHGW
jgi:hypothetical protein